MKALVLTAYNKFEYMEVPVPRSGAGEVLVRVKAAAVCGSDVHGMDGSTGRRRPPLIMGHEASGEIAKVGSGVIGWAPGDRVTFDSTVYCSQCDMCRAGHINLCGSRRVLGVSCEDYRLDGAFAEYVAVPQHILYRLPEGVTWQQGAMVEPLAIAYHAATRTQVRPGDTAVILGVGTIGMLTLQVVKSMGARDLIAVDIDDAKLMAARRRGATSTVNSRSADALEQILALTPEGKGAGIVFDATGINDTLQLGLKALALNGTAVLVGNLAPQVDLPLQWVVTRQLSLLGSCASAGEYDACLRLIADGLVDVDALISRAVPMSEGHAWITRVYQREPGLNKIVLLPEEA